MAFNISYVYQIKNKFSAQAAKIKAQTKGITASFKALQSRVKKVGASMSSFGKGLSLKVTAPILAIAGFALKSAADIETLGVAFTSMTGSAVKSAMVVKGLISFAAKTPFQLIGIGKAAKQLLAAGVTVKNLQGKLKFLGDIAAGANVPLSDMAAIFAKSKAKGKAMTEELLQLSDRGIPIISVLAKQLNVSKEAVFDLASKSKINFAVLEKAMISMSSKGGVFADQMAKQSDTLAGVWSTLKDNVNLALASLGAQIATTFDLKSTINSVIGFIQRATAAFNNFTKENPRLAKLAIIMVAVAAAIGPILIVVGTLAAGFASLAGGAVLLGVSFAAIAIPVLIAGAAITAIGVAIALVIAFWDDLKQAMQNVLDFWSGGFLQGVLKVGAAVKDMISLIPDLFTNGGEINVNRNIGGDIGGLGNAFAAEEDINSGGPGVASQTLTNNSRLDGQITVNAAPGTVKSVESKTSGAGMNLGFNMAGL